MQKPPLPLRLSVKCLNWRMNDADAADADAEFKRVRKSALERDQHSCRFCGFKSLHWQEVHHSNDDHADNRLDNLITTCPFCHMCQHIGLAGSNKEAVLIYLPQISQADLHHIVRTALIAERALDVIRSDQRSAPPLIRQHREAADVAKAVLAALRSRSEGAEKRILTSDPAEIANVLKMLPDDAYARRDDALAGIRLLPLGKRSKGHEDIMVKHLDSWMATGGPYALLKPNAWLGVLKAVLAG
jgi:intracellular multiplication protein IcmJ